MSVHIRKRKRLDGTTRLYLDIYKNGVRKYESLKLYLTGDSQVDSRTLKIAEEKRNKREKEIFYSKPQRSEFLKTDNFLDFFLSFAKSNYKVSLYNNWHAIYNYLDKFSKSHIIFADINNEWIEKFQNYLLRKVSNNSAYIYMNKLKLSIDHARRCGLINDNPLKLISKIKREDRRLVHLTINVIQKLADTDCKYLEIKRAFLFSCLTGISIDSLKIFVKKDVYTKYSIIEREEGYDLCQSAKEILSLDPNFNKKDSSEKIFKLPSKSTIWRCLEKWRQDAGIKKHLSLRTPILSHTVHSHIFRISSR